MERVLNADDGGMDAQARLEKLPVNVLPVPLQDRHGLQSSQISIQLW
jgi:hypothetical protein